jgi:hypothetical protein
VGDLIRTVCNTAEEVDPDTSKVDFNFTLFRALVEGYLSEAAEFLTDNERRLLVESGRNLTQIMGLRFLTDYLEGDVYYNIKHPETNRDRCRNQIALIKAMDGKWKEAEEICGSISA